jgi:hypothetical protein
MPTDKPRYRTAWTMTSAAPRIIGGASAGQRRYRGLLWQTPRLPGENCRPTVNAGLTSFEGLMAAREKPAGALRRRDRASLRLALEHFQKD